LFGFWIENIKIGGLMNPKMFRCSLMVLFLVICSAEIPILAQNITQEFGIDPKESAKHFPKRGYSPYADRVFPTRPLWGDTHLHTANSPDAFAFGNRLGPEEAYRFAQGEAVTSATNQRVQTFTSP
jgi:hypothetical protein